MMKRDQSFTTTFSVEQSPQRVFDAINNVRGWWSEEIDGDTETVGGEFTYRYEDLHQCKIRVTELVPARSIIWLVLDNYFSFTEDKTEWKGTTISFDISERNGKTEVHFTHLGLTPEYECFEACREGWGNYINTSLQKLITTGQGLPNGRGRPRTSAEAKLGIARPVEAA